jgi:prepilin-type N-terminal cleavage/methylation domain-containing protein
MRPRAFTLVEMLLATALAAILMGGVLAVASGLSRDRRRMEAHAAAEHSPVAAELLRRDLANAVALLNTSGAGDVELLGYSGVDPVTLRPDGRLVRVLYHLDRRDPRGGGGGGVLTREQAYLDDPVRVDRFTEIVATNVTRLSLGGLATGAEQVRLGEEIEVRLRNLTAGRASSRGVRLPPRLRLRIEYSNSVDDREVVLR